MRYGLNACRGAACTAYSKMACCTTRTVLRTASNTQQAIPGLLRMQKRLPRNANGCNTCKTERTLARNLPHTHSTALSRKGQAGTANQQTHVMTSASFPTCTSQAPGPRRMHPQTLEPEFGLDARVYPDGPGRSSDASEPLRLAACTAGCPCGLLCKAHALALRWWHARGGCW